MADSPFNSLEEPHRSKGKVLILIRGIFLITLVTVVMLTLLKEQSDTGSDPTIPFFVDWWWVPVIVAVFLGSAAIIVDALTPRKKLSGLMAIFFGLIAGLLTTVLLSWVFELLLETHDIQFPPGDKGRAIMRIILAIKAAVAISLCYLGAAIVYSTQDEFRLIIPYVEFSKQLRGSRPLIMDTSAIIDGRMNDIASTGFVAAPIVVPRFVIDELQTLSDSADRLKRNRGRRGLDIIRKMQNNALIDLSIMDVQVTGIGVDQKLVELAQQHRAHLVTTDFNLNKVASIHGVKVLNVNDLANALKPVAIPGGHMQVAITKTGEAADQGVGYLDDGTMVVVEHASRRIGSTVNLTVTSTIQTSAGRMIFGEISESVDGLPTPLDEPSADVGAESYTAGRMVPRSGDGDKPIGPTGSFDARASISSVSTAAGARALADPDQDHVVDAGPGLDAGSGNAGGDSAASIPPGESRSSSPALPDRRESRPYTPGPPQSSPNPPRSRGPSRRNPRRGGVSDQ